jgi:hypothetical protein
VVIYEISKDALSPLLEGRPGLVEELSESLASRRLARKVVLDCHHHRGSALGALSHACGSHSSAAPNKALRKFSIIEVTASCD